MANTFLKPTVIAAAALGLLQREIVLPSLIWRDAAGNYDGAFNDTVSIRVPARAKARRMALRDRSTAITTDDLAETKIDVSLDTHVYHAASVTDEELSMDITDFGAQILMPQVRAIAEDIEDQVAAEMTGATYATSLVVDALKPENTLVDARAALNKQNVPFADRFVVLGADMESLFLKADGLKRVNEAGSDDVLTEAKLGRLRGFDIYASNAIPPGQGYAFHRTAYVLGMRAPSVPDGATFGRSESYASLAMRWLRDYDAAYLRDRSVVSVFTGTNIVADGPDGPDAGTAPDFVRAVKLTLV
ncbi:P22 phage major capsid protein family protein [Longispora sp. NPDC051575]|uniref:P22 phage major capsid protein family protein n=1 Tax=Longispora sp. NPDC051575 TaxID=3154943 RepID=UPI003435F9E0